MAKKAQKWQKYPQILPKPNTMQEVALPWVEKYRPSSLTDLVAHGEYIPHNFPSKPSKKDPFPYPSLRFFTSPPFPPFYLHRFTPYFRGYNQRSNKTNRQR